MKCPNGCPSGCPTGTHGRTDGVSPSVRPVGACWVQNQNQNQTVLKAVVGLSVVNAKSIHQAVDARRMDGRSAAIDGCGR